MTRECMGFTARELALFSILISHLLDVMARDGCNASIQRELELLRDRIDTSLYLQGLDEFGNAMQ